MRWRSARCASELRLQDLTCQLTAGSVCRTLVHTSGMVGPGPILALRGRRRRLDQGMYCAVGRHTQGVLDDR